MKHMAAPSTPQCRLALTCSFAWHRCPLVCRYLGTHCPTDTPDGNEIESVSWLHWQYIASKQDWEHSVDFGYGLSPSAEAQVQDAFHIPTASSLAHRMLQRWVAAKAQLGPGARVPECSIDVGRCAASAGDPSRLLLLHALRDPVTKPVARIGQTLRQALSPLGPSCPWHIYKPFVLYTNTTSLMLLSCRVTDGHCDCPAGSSTF